ncbi:MAG: CHAD domain-containing protein [Deltaproteobacteria bacterium]|nr:CHAD domain-containing protein [Deltaproteobacteria bacterium]
MAAEHDRPAGAAVAHDRPAEKVAPARSVRRRAAQVIDEQRAKMFAQVAAAVDGRDPEGVHDMRVASRRLRAALKVFAPWLAPEDLARIAPAVRTLTRALGRVRELDVLRLRLSGLGTHATPPRAIAIECVDARLARQRRRARARMMAAFAKVDLDRLDARLQRLVARLERDTPVAQAPPGTVADAPSIDAVAAAHGAQASLATHTGGRELSTRDPGGRESSTWDPGGRESSTWDPGGRESSTWDPGDPPIGALLEELAPAVLEEARAVSRAELPVEVGTPHSAEALHRVRVAAKKLRYTLEIVVPYLGADGAAVVKRLRGAQEHLGDFHDDCVLDDTLRPAVERARQRGRPLLATELRALRTGRRRALVRDERAVRAALATLRDEDFAGIVARTLVAAGVSLPDPEPAVKPGASAAQAGA